MHEVSVNSTRAHRSAGGLVAALERSCGAGAARPATEMFVLGLNC
jgi:hypothetical protein